MVPWDKVSATPSLIPTTQWAGGHCQLTQATLATPPTDRTQMDILTDGQHNYEHHHFTSFLKTPEVGGRCCWAINAAKKCSYLHLSASGRVINFCLKNCNS